MKRVQLKQELSEVQSQHKQERRERNRPQHPAQHHIKVSSSRYYYSIIHNHSLGRGNLGRAQQGNQKHGIRSLFITWDYCYTRGLVMTSQQQTVASKFPPSPLDISTCRNIQEGLMRVNLLMLIKY